MRRTLACLAGWTWVRFSRLAVFAAGVAHRRIKKRTIIIAGAAVLLAGAGVAATAIATGGASLSANLTGYQEVPPNNTGGTGTFTAQVQGNNSITYTLSYSNLSAPVTQAHLQFGGIGENGGVFVFLCGTAASPAPAGTPTCPQAGTVTRTISAADVIGPTSQGVAAGNISGLIGAIDAGLTYVNVSTTAFPAGEIRAQLNASAGLPAGPTGPTGDTGATGPRGQTGAQGATGASGQTGARGARGGRGARGSRGPRGSSGKVTCRVVSPKNPQALDSDVLEVSCTVNQH